MHISMLRWCSNNAIRTINVVKKQISLQIFFFLSKYSSFVYYQGHFMFEYKCMYFLKIFFTFEYKCMHVFSKTKCIFKYKCMHVYARRCSKGYCFLSI